MTEEEVKEKYGPDVKKIEVFISENDTAVGYVLKATRYVMSPILTKINTDPLGAVEIWLQSCLIKEISDPRILEDDCLISCMQLMDSIVSVKKSKLTSI